MHWSRNTWTSWVIENMKINVFKIPKQNVSSLKEKIKKLEMSNKHLETQDGWIGTFYLSSRPEVDDISWVKDYETTVPDISSVKNVVYYAIYLFEKGNDCFALTYGKSHFYVRKFCDADFGLEMAKRIANENDVKQKASKRFSGRKKKEIKSFVKNTKLDSESGESVDYISAGIIPDKQIDFGEKSKFGSSLIISREDLVAGSIPATLDTILKVLGTEEARFDLPKTIEVNDPVRVAGYVTGLREQIKNDITNIDTEDNSYDLVGTDFVFYTSEKYTFHLGQKKSDQVSELSHGALKKFIDDNDVQDDQILNIKVDIANDNGKEYTKSLYEMIEYMVPNENVVLEGGKWKEFNKEYLEQIDASINAIAREETESEFLEISLNEPDFNSCSEVAAAGYAKDDTDFSKVNIGAGYTVEAWDLRKGNIVHAVKFGSTQKLVYVCSQAMTMLDIIRNNANLKKLDNPPERYCLWLGFKRTVPEKISDIRSIILKQHIDMFARKCWEVGIVPVLKFSHKVKKNDENEE